VAAGLVSPRQVLAAWPQAAFDAISYDAAFSSVFASSSATESGEVSVKLPTIAENGVVVAISLSSTLKDVQSVTFFAKNNPTPLITRFELDGIR
jgi:sulfur-oxidizing protein SoxY